MKKRRNPFSRIRIVFRPGNPVVKIVLLAVVLLSIGAMIMINSAIKEGQADQDRIKQQIADAQKDNDKYKDGIDNAGTQDGLKDYAENELGLSPTGNTIFVGESKP
jgi:cell division protein FtsL